LKSEIEAKILRKGAIRAKTQNRVETAVAFVVLLQMRRFVVCEPRRLIVSHSLRGRFLSKLQTAKSETREGKPLLKAEAHRHRSSAIASFFRPGCGRKHSVRRDVWMIIIQT